MKYIVLAFFVGLCLVIAGSLAFVLHFYGFVELDLLTAKRLAVTLAIGIGVTTIVGCVTIIILKNHLRDAQNKIKSYHITMT